MGIAVLGPLRVEGVTGGLAPRDRVVLAALVVRLGDVMSAEQLADALWGEEPPPPSWTKSLQGSIVRLRKTLGSHVIETVGHGYRLTLPAREVDAYELERLVARGRELLDLGEPERAAHSLGEALRLWQGPPLAELDGWQPGQVERERLQELHRDAEELRVDALLRAGRHAESLADARRLVEQAPLRERRWELLALAQYRSGRQADALRTLTELRRVLVTELGLDPGPELVALEAAILRQEPELLVHVTPVEPSATCPYPGLVPYDVTDADGYFGREQDVEACLRRLSATGIVAVVGPSGSGKSSLVRAGVAARIRAEGGRVEVITPGVHPMRSWSEESPRGRPPVLVVDQAEEAFTQCEDAAERLRFLDALAERVATGGLVLALRADRFGDLAASGELARLVEQGLHLLRPMGEAELRSAIEGPARQAGLRLEAGLVEVLVAEVVGHPGALPHLSHALRLTWERREGGVLTLEGYRATGGIHLAVARSAERVYDALAVDERPLLRDLMLRLVSPTPEGEPVRARVPRRQLSADAAHERLVERLVAARLVTSDEGVVELAHEALARAWPRLQGWLDDDTAGQRILRHLAGAADTWDTMGRPADELYRGVRLAQALEWRDRAETDPTPVESAFLEAGEARQRAEEQSALDQARSQARTNRRLRGLLVAAVMLLVSAVVTGALAVGAANRASDVSEVADARRVAALSQLSQDTARSLRLALAAHHLEPSPETSAGLLAALARNPQLEAVVPAPGSYVDVSPDGTVASLDDSNVLHLYEAGTYEHLGDYDPFPPEWQIEDVGTVSNPLAFAPDGRQIAMLILNIDDAVVRLVDTPSLRASVEQPGGQPEGSVPSDVDWSRDGRYLAVSWSAVEPPGRDWVSVWDMRDARHPDVRFEAPSYNFHLEFSGDGRRLYLAPAWNNTDWGVGTRVYDRATGRLVESRPEGGHGLDSSPDGRTLAWGDESDVVLADAATGEIEHRLRGLQKRVQSVTFSPDGSRVAAVAEDLAMVWQVDSARVLESVPVEASPPAYAVRFDPTGDRLVLPGLAVVDLTGTSGYLRRVMPPDPVPPGVGESTRVASPYAPVVAVSTWDPTIQRSRGRLVDRRTGRTTVRLGAGGETVWAPDGQHLAYRDEAGWLRVHEVRTGELLVRRRREIDSVVAYTADSRRILVVDEQGLTLLDAGTLRPATDPVRLPGVSMSHVALGPSDDTAFVLTATPTGGPLDWYTAPSGWSLVDLRTGERLRSGQLAHSVASTAVSPDRERVALAGPGRLEILDLSTGGSTSAPTGSTETEEDGWSVTWSPDGALLASSDGDGRVTLRDGRSGEALGTVDPADQALDQAVVPLFLDEDTLYLPYLDGSAYTWDTDVEHAVDVACRIAGGGLTPDEWRAVLGTRPYEDACG